MAAKTKRQSLTAPMPASRSESRVGENGSVPAETIRQRAQEIYRSRLAEGRPGDATSDWLEAERQLLELAATARP